jgi:haloalkane dehalogenase
MAYIDETVGDGLEETFLCLHGQPTWSYLYRKMIPVFLKYTTLNHRLSRRVIAPDLFGFGRSDKPIEDSAYTFNFHRDALLHFIRTLDLTNITLVVQDWGGMLGLTLPISDPWRFKRLIVMNTTLATGSELSQGFLDWRAFSNRSPDMNVGAVIRRSCPHLSKTEVETYNVPYPNKDYKAGVRRFPNLVMIREDMEGVDISRECLEMYKRSGLFTTADIFMACGQRDPVLGPPVMEVLAQVWKNGCYYAEIEEAGHFVQEWGDRVAKLAIEVFERQGRVKGVRKVGSQQAVL